MIKRINKFLKKHSFKEIKKIIDYQYGLGLFERTLSTNWFNPILTIYLNFRSFPIKQAIHLPLFVYGHPRIYGLSGEMIIEGKIKTGMIKFNHVKRGAPNNMSVQSEIYNNGIIKFQGNGYIGTGCKINIGHNGTLFIGKDFKIADMCNIGVFSYLCIGEYTRIAHRCQILDANYHYVANFNKRIIPKWHSPIIIGKGVWVCNSTTITGGSIIPDYCIIASNSLVSKDFSSASESSLIGGIPAKLIASNFRRVENPQKERIISKFYKENPDGIYHIPEEDSINDYSIKD